MASYEIRLLRQRNRAKPVYRINASSDLAAICAARKAAESGDRIEVWRGMDCIYAAQQDGDFSMLWPRAATSAPAPTNA